MGGGKKFCLKALGTLEFQLRACEMEVAKGKEKDGYSFLKNSLRVLFVSYPPHAEYNALCIQSLGKCLCPSIFKAEIPIHLPLKKEDQALLKFLTQTSEGDIANHVPSAAD